MKRLNRIWIMLPLMLLFSCTEDIIIDLEEGEPMVGVEASFTNELKHHEAILSYTANFYNSEDVEMISGAHVFVTDGVDTIPYIESAEEPGHYFTDLVAGKKNTFYRLQVAVPDEREKDGFLHLTAESFMKDNVEFIDSLVMKPYQSVSGLPMFDTIICMYPYFQSLPDMSIVYMIDIWKNDTLQTDTLTSKMSIPMAGYAGYYINGEEFLQENMEIPISFTSQKKLHDGDRFKADIISIPTDYMVYVYSLSASLGSNPMMGPPSNVITNIQPQGKGVGWFYAASVVSAETVWHKPNR